MRKDRAFSRVEFQRRFLADLEERDCWFATAEDTILAKLEWSKMGESERQFSDAVNIAKIQAQKLDVYYLKIWALQLEISELLERVPKEIEGFQ